jgi:fumarate hydratase class II
MITAYAILKKAAANANYAAKRLGEEQHRLILEVCDEILAGQHNDMFPLHVWMTGTGTQFNMNINEVISNRSCQLAGTPVGSKRPVHPNDHVNMSQSSNDTFPAALALGSPSPTQITANLVFCHASRQRQAFVKLRVNRTLAIQT